MNYGKNQIALLKFLEKYPNRWNTFKGRKAIDAARRLSNKDSNVLILKLPKSNWVHVFLKMPQMLIKQN